MLLRESTGLSLNMLIAFQEKENAASMSMCKVSPTSSGVISRNGLNFQIPCSVFHKASVIMYLLFEKLCRISCHVVGQSSRQHRM